MFWSKNKKNRYSIPQFCYIKVGFEGIHIAWTCLRDGKLWSYSSLHVLKQKCVHSLNGVKLNWTVTVTTLKIYLHVHNFSSPGLQG